MIMILWGRFIGGRTKPSASIHANPRSAPHSLLGKEEKAGKRRMQTAVSFPKRRISIYEYMYMKTDKI